MVLTSFQWRCSIDPIQGLSVPASSSQPRNSFDDTCSPSWRSLVLILQCRAEIDLIRHLRTFPTNTVVVLSAPSVSAYWPLIVRGPLLELESLVRRVDQSRSPSMVACKSGEVAFGGAKIGCWNKSRFVAYVATWPFCSLSGSKTASSSDSSELWPSFKSSEPS